MSADRSNASKAAWEKARQLAAERGISVREARSLLAKGEKPAPAPPSAPKSKKPRKPAEPKGKPTDDLAAAEAKLRQKYPHIVPGTLRPPADGSHKRTVEIACQRKDCDRRRRIATSDVWQVRFCPECTKAVRQERRSSKSKGNAAHE